MSATNVTQPSVTMLRPEINRFDAADVSANARPRLLIVDDISDNRAVLTRRFHRRGFDVVEADSGFAAIELIGSELFDLVLLDVMMPGIDGIETLKRIRDQKSTSALPVIMVTAKSESDNIVGALNLVPMTMSPSRSILRSHWLASTRRSAESSPNSGWCWRTSNCARPTKIWNAGSRSAPAA